MITDRSDKSNNEAEEAEKEFPDDSTTGSGYSQAEREKQDGTNSASAGSAKSQTQGGS